MIEYRKRIKHFPSLVFLIFLLFCVAIAATAQTPQQIAQKAFRSTVLLVMEDANGQPLSLGSGFFCRLTNQISLRLTFINKISCLPFGTFSGCLFIMHFHLLGLFR